MTQQQRLLRLAALDSNTISDALDFLGLSGATNGLMPLWTCPKIVGLASTVQLGPKVGHSPTVHLISPVIDEVTDANHILVIAGGVEGISSWGDILANAAKRKGIRGTVIDGFSRDINGSASINYPVYGRGVTMISARNRLVQIDSGNTVTVAGVQVAENDYVIADECGSVFIASAAIDQVLDLGERIAARQQRMVEAVRGGQSVEQVMHDSQFEAINKEAQA